MSKPPLLPGHVTASPRAKDFDRISMWFTIPLAVIGATLPLVGFRGVMEHIALILCPVFVFTAVIVSLVARNKLLQVILEMEAVARKDRLKDDQEKT